MGTITKQSRFAFYLYRDSYNDPPPPASNVQREITFWGGQSSVTKPDWRRSNWRDLIANGQDATTPMNGVKWSAKVIPFQATHGFTKQINPPPWVRTTYFLRGAIVQGTEFPGNPESLSEVSADNKAKVRYIEKCREAQTAMRSLVTIGEFAETYRMLKSPAKALRSRIDDYVKFVRRQPYKSPRKANRFIRHAWLEYSLGWSPLIHDIESAYNLYTRYGNEQRFPFRYIKATGVWHDPTSSVSSGAGLWIDQGNMRVYYTRTVDKVVMVTYRGVVDAVVDSSIRSDNFRLAGLRMDEFVPTMWELIPYSFLVDYFVNIGSILDCLSFPKSTIRWTAKTIYKEHRVENAATSLMHFPLTDLDIKRSTLLQPGSTMMSRSSFSRGTYSGSLVPSLQITLPNSGKQWLNVAALASLRLLHLR